MIPSKDLDGLNLDRWIESATSWLAAMNQERQDFHVSKHHSGSIFIRPFKTQILKPFQIMEKHYIVHVFLYSYWIYEIALHNRDLLLDFPASKRKRKKEIQ
jgi:hypothetical protein